MERRTALFALLAVLGLAAAVVLFEVLTVVFFALTVALVASPIFDMLDARGLPATIASALTTVLVFFVAGLLFLPLAMILYLRRGTMVSFLRSLPEEITLTIGPVSRTIDALTVQEMLVNWVQTIAVGLLAAAPALAFELALFVLVVYGVLLGRGEIRAATYAVVPRSYHDIVTALEMRAKQTLWAIYVLQAATALATFLLALPVFWVLGYEAFVTLAVIAGVLQFLPIIGPSVLLLLLAVFHVSQGEVGAAVLILAVGGLVIAWIPDGIVRPRLAAYTTNMRGSLYFIGFIGGLLSLGAVGVILGPLVIALLVEAVRLVSEELRIGPPEV